MAGDSGRTLTLRLVSDVRAATRGIDQVNSRLRGFGRGLGAAAGALGVGLAVDQVVQFGREVVGAASEAEQAVGGVEAVFGRFSKQVERDAKTAASSVGLSATEYRTFATQLGGQLKAAGVPMREIAGRTDEMIDRAADLAATYGGSTADAVSALGSAFRGEADPAERFLLNLRQSEVTAEAVRLGLADTTTEVDQQARAMATASLIMSQSTDAAGQFARESDTLAGRSAQLSASWENAKVTLGNVLMPVVLGFIDLLTEHVIPAVKLVARVIVEWWKRILPQIRPIFAGIVDIVRAVIKLIRAAWDMFGPIIMRQIRAVVQFVQTVFGSLIGIIRGIVDIVAGILTGKWDRVWEGAKRVIVALRDLIGGIGSYIVQTLGNYVAAIGTAAAAIGRAIANGLVSAWNALDVAVGPWSIPSWVPVVGGSTFHIPDLFPDIALLGKGGIVRRPTLAVVGERGPEAVTPLGQFGSTYVINIETGIGDPVRIGAAVVDAISAFERANGRRWRTA